MLIIINAVKIEREFRSTSSYDVGQTIMGRDQYRDCKYDLYAILNLDPLLASFISEGILFHLVICWYTNEFCVAVQLNRGVFRRLRFLVL